MDNSHIGSDNIFITIDDIDEDVDDIQRQRNNKNDSSNTPAIMPWMIPRPTLIKSENLHAVTVENLFEHNTMYPTNLLLALPSPSKNNSSSSSTSSTSKASSKSANSNTLLLTTSNLAKWTSENGKPHHEYVISSGKSYDTESLASSTHFTLVNGMERKLPKHLKPVKCCCEKHQLSILITTMTMFLAFTILFCIYFVQLKMQDQNHLS